MQKINITDYLDEIKNIFNEINSKIEENTNNKMSYEYLINHKKNIINSLEKIILENQINKYQIEYLNLQEKRIEILKNNNTDELYKINTRLVYLYDLIKNY
jgi:hypothetical protein